MWCELEIPLELAGIGIESEHAIGVKIVAGARSTIEIRRWIAGSPIDRVQIGIVPARHPSCTAAAQIHVSGPTGCAELARPWDGPEAPRFFARRSIECRKES